MNSSYLIFMVALLLSSCSILKPKEDGIAVAIHGTVHKPYCGGARPSPDVAAGYYEPLNNQSFKVYQGKSFSVDLKENSEFTFDQEGNVSLNLNPGTYFFVQSDKLLPLDKFMEKYAVAPSDHYVVKDEGCFNEWKNTVDLYLDVKNDTLVEFRQKARCWVGTNPCLVYVGPPAP
ncbi:MAG: hypothetical protein RIT43_1064 [Bacteroidota bacterium]|jgi:hypothetical protein